MLSWVWNYAVFAKGARLITGGAAPDVKRLALHPRDVADRVPQPRRPATSARKDLAG
jgi:hypothetical protein